MMSLLLINDLPLFNKAVKGDLEKAVSTCLEPLISSAPSQVDLMLYESFFQRMAEAVLGTADAVVLVGTRPNLIARQVDIGSRRVFSIFPEREHDVDGHTSNVKLPSLTDDLSEVHNPIAIVDDVAMSGATLCSVLEFVGLRSHLGWSVTTVIATREAIMRVEREWPGNRIESQITLEHAPITEGTVIFLQDLLFGNLRDIPFIEQSGFLRPLFGDDTSVLRSLRKYVVENAAPLISDAKRG